MKNGIFIGALILCISSVALADDFKGEPEPAQANLGAMVGLGVIDAIPGFTLLGTASKKIIERGFVTDVNDSVSIEGQAGPFFARGSTAFMYSAHLRWDFEKDLNWTFYALAGLGGNITPSALGGNFELYPRFGVGAMLHLAEGFALRGEISHEFIGVGVSFPF